MQQAFSICRIFCSLSFVINRAVIQTWSKHWTHNNVYLLIFIWQCFDFEYSHNTVFVAIGILLPALTFKGRILSTDCIYTFRAMFSESSYNFLKSVLMCFLLAWIYFFLNFMFIFFIHVSDTFNSVWCTLRVYFVEMFFTPFRLAENSTNFWRMEWSGRALQGQCQKTERLVRITSLLRSQSYWQRQRIIQYKTRHMLMKVNLAKTEQILLREGREYKFVGWVKSNHIYFLDKGLWFVSASSSSTPGVEYQQSCRVHFFRQFKLNVSSYDVKRRIETKVGSRIMLSDSNRFRKERKFTICNI